MGNMNNKSFMLAREYKRMGYDVVFIIHYHKENKLCRPEYRYKDIQYPYPEWIVEEVLPEAKLYLFGLGSYINKIKSILNQCDYVFLNDSGHLFRNFLDKKVVSASLASGADLDASANYSAITKETFRKNSFLIACLKYPFTMYKTFLQRKGFEKAEIITYFPKGINIEGDIIIDKIQHKNKNISREFFQMSEVNDLKFTHLPNNKIPILFSATRFEWGNDSSILQKWSKGNDIMIRGVALFYEKTKTKIFLNLVEKGSSVKKTKELINSLGIEDIVIWHKEMSQKEVYEWYEKSDVIIEQLGNHLIAMAGLDAMAIGRPVIGNARNKILEPVIGEKSAVCDASTPEEVCQWIERLILDQNEKKVISLQSRKYVEQHFAPSKYATRFLDILTNKSRIYE